MSGRHGRILENPNRQRLIDLLSHGSQTTRQLLDETGLGWGCLHYHLALLMRSGLIGGRLVLGKRLYYPGRGRDPAPERLEFDASPPMRRLVELVMEGRGPSQKDLQAQSGVSQRMCSYYLRRLEARGLVLRERRGSLASYWATPRLHELARDASDLPPPHATPPLPSPSDAVGARGPRGTLAPERLGFDGITSSANIDI